MLRKADHYNNEQKTLIALFGFKPEKLGNRIICLLILLGLCDLVLEILTV